MDTMVGQWEIEGMTRIPLLGDVAAGQPLDVFSVEESLDVPESLWNGRKVFALRVRGQSMVEAGIRDGDYLIVEPCATADNGRTVVAEVDGRVTVKKLYREAGGQIRLQPANAEMLPLVVRGEQVRILGAVVGVLRKYGFSRAGEAKARRTESPTPPRLPTKPERRPPADDTTLDLGLNAIDAHLTRSKGVLDDPQGRLGDRDRARMVELVRDLQALRDWCARTSKPSLRRALIQDASRVMQRLDRFLAARALTLPDLILH